MQKRKLGRSGLEISTLVLGGNVFGWTVDREASFGVLNAYAAAGGNCIDTADGYSIWVPGNKGGESETIIGEWMKRRGNRDRLIVATKVGWELSPTRKGLSRSYILTSVEGSLTRLQTSYIDLYQSHRDDPDTTPDETLEAYDRSYARARCVSSARRTTRPRGSKPHWKPSRAARISPLRESPTAVQPLRPLRI